MPGKALKVGRIAAAAAFNPSSLFSGNKGGFWTMAQNKVWSDNGITQITDTTAIQRVDDQSGNANHLVQATGANKPVWAANAGNPYAQFDGGVDVMIAALASNITGSNLTGIFAGRRDAGAANFCRFLATIAGAAASYTTLSSILFGYSNSGVFTPLYNSVSGPTSALADATDVVAIVELNASTIKLKVDAGADNSVAHGQAVALNSDSIYLGADLSAVNSLLGRVHGALVIDRVLTGTEKSQCATYFGALQGRSI